MPHIDIHPLSRSQGEGGDLIWDDIDQSGNIFKSSAAGEPNQLDVPLVPDGAGMGMP